MKCLSRSMNCLILSISYFFKKVIQNVFTCNQIGKSLVMDVLVVLLKSSGKIPMLTPCMKSSSEMQMKASVLLYKDKKVHLWAFLELRSSSGSELISDSVRGSGRELKNCFKWVQVWEQCPRMSDPFYF